MAGRCLARLAASPFTRSSSGMAADYSITRRGVRFSVSPSWGLARLRKALRNRFVAAHAVEMAYIVRCVASDLARADAVELVK